MEQARSVKRKLAAIFSADVQGYSRLMGADEVATLHTLTVYREVMVTLIQQYEGRAVGSAGDRKDPAVSERYFAALRKAGLK